VKRRDFITLLGGAVAMWPLGAQAQQPIPPVIGWLSDRNSEADAAGLSAFRQGLAEQAFVIGQNVTFEYRFADGQHDRLPALAADLARRNPAVIIAGPGPQLALAARAANPNVPIIFMGPDPVEAGLVSNLTRPDGNMTGITALSYALGSKRLGLLHDLLPNASTIAVLYNPESGNKAELDDAQAAAASFGQQIKILNARTARDIDSAFAGIAQMRADALLVATSPLFVINANQIIGLAARYRIPALYFRREFTAAGGLISYGSSANEGMRVVGVYAGRILKGAKAADLPVQRATHFELVINLKTAKALGLTVSPTLLVAAEEVIE
jgi:putative tryptophan/tyrosine transport system substrate-binding protein